MTVDEIFLTIRAWNYWHPGPLLKEHRAKMKLEAVWQIGRQPLFRRGDRSGDEWPRRTDGTDVPL
jgi:hypothetical protein